MLYWQQNMKKTNLIVAATITLAAAMVFGLIYINGYSNGYHLQTASAAVKGKDTNTSTTKDTIQLSTKEVKPGVYNWIGTTNGTPNPTLKAFANVKNIIKIQNPTDTKHELIIDTGADVLPSSNDINPNASGQLSFSPTMAGTFTYHCAYHPFTMKGTIQIVSSNP